MPAVRSYAISGVDPNRRTSARAGGGALPVIMSIIRSSANPRLPRCWFFWINRSGTVTWLRVIRNSGSTSARQEATPARIRPQQPPCAVDITCAAIPRASGAAIGMGHSEREGGNHHSWKVLHFVNRLVDGGCRLPPTVPSNRSMRSMPPVLLPPACLARRNRGGREGWRPPRIDSFQHK